MNKITYEQAYKDHSYLWGIGPAYDMTGGYVDQQDLTKLLKKPTKSTAISCLCDQIAYWFQVGPDVSRFDRKTPATQSIKSDATVRDIAERHGII